MTYIVTPTGHKYHIEGGKCGYTRDGERGYSHLFDTREEAEDEGFRPCVNCFAGGWREQEIHGADKDMA